MSDDREFRRRFFQQMQDEPLDPDDPRYVQLYDADHDVIQEMQETILFSGMQSCQLLSGYRGAGKSTELRRLRRDLIEQGYKVVLVDIRAYLDLHSPLDVSDFLLGLCGGLGESLKHPDLLGDDPVAETVWQRFWNWMQADIEVKELTPKVKGVGGEVALKVEIRENPSFRQRLQEVLAERIGQLVIEVQAFVDECVSALRRRHSEAAQLVILVDSVEHARGVAETERAVHDAIARLFGQHDDKLRLAGVHVVYTVPPWLRIRLPNVGSRYSGAGLYTLPAQKVRARRPGEAPGPVHRPGIECLTRLVAQRGDWTRLLAGPEVLERLILVSGGHLRDLVRLLQTIAVMARDLPASPALIDRAIGRLREQFLPIATDDARWLSDIARSRSAELAHIDRMGTLSRYFDSHLVLSYINGESWYDVHPLVRDHVLGRAPGPDDGI